MRLLLGTFIQEESFWWEARFPGGAWEGSNSKEQLGEKREKWKMKTETSFRLWWRARFLEESRARKPRQQATINAGPYCRDKHLRALLPRHTLSTFSKERYSNKCWYLLLEMVEFEAELCMFLKEKYSHKCWNLLLKFAQSLRLVLGAFSKAMNSNKCWYLLLGMFAACVSTRFMVVVWEWDKYCWFLSWDSYIVNCAREISVVEREISEFSLHNKISSLSLVFPKVWGFSRVKFDQNTVS